MNVLSVTHFKKEEANLEHMMKKYTSLVFLQATMVFNVINETNILKKKTGKQKSFYHYRINSVNIFSLTCERSKFRL